MERPRNLKYYYNYYPLVLIYYIPVYGKQLQDYDVRQRDQEYVAAFVNTTVLKNKYNYIIMQKKSAYKIDEGFI